MKTKFNVLKGEQQNPDQNKQIKDNTHYFLYSYRVFTKAYHMLNHKTMFNTFKMTEIT